MTVKKIIQNCKKTGWIAIYEDEKRMIQWLSDGFALYPLYRMPKFDTETICLTYDITEKQADKMRFIHKSELPFGYCYSDVDDGEHICDPIEMTFIHSGAKVQPYMTSQGIKFMDEKYIAPVEDEGNSFMEVYERFTESGEMYFVVKSGMQLLAIIQPIRVVSRNFVDTLKELYTRSRIMLESEEKPDA